MSERLVFDDGIFDELVAEGVDVHLERMSNGEMCLVVNDPEKPAAPPLLHAYLSAHRGHLILTVNETGLDRTDR